MKKVTDITLEPVFSNKDLVDYIVRFIYVIDDDLFHNMKFSFDPESFKKSDKILETEIRKTIKKIIKDFNKKNIVSNKKQIIEGSELIKKIGFNKMKESELA